MNVTHPANRGYLPARLDPYGMIAGPINHHHRLRFADGDGGAGGDGGGGEGGDDGGDGGAGGGDEELGPAGQRAYDRQKETLKQTKATLKEFEGLGLTAAELAEIVAEKNKGNAPDEQAIRKAAEKQATEQATERIQQRVRVSSAREQAALLGFIDPKDAIANVSAKDLADVDVDDDDEADVPAIKKLLEKVATAKPYLLKPKDSTADHRTAGIGSGGGGSQPQVQPGQARMASAYAEASKK